MTEQLYNSIDFVLHWEKKAKERKRKKKDWQGQKRSTDAFIKYKRPTESWLPERSLTIHNGVKNFLKNKHSSFQK